MRETELLRLETLERWENERSADPEEEGHKGVLTKGEIRAEEAVRQSETDGKLMRVCQPLDLIWEWEV